MRLHIPCFLQRKNLPAKHLSKQGVPVSPFPENHFSLRIGLKTLPDVIDATADCNRACTRQFVFEPRAQAVVQASFLRENRSSNALNGHGPVRRFTVPIRKCLVVRGMRGLHYLFSTDRTAYRGNRSIKRWTG